MKTPREDRCDRCRHWERLEDDALEDVGLCHRFPRSVPNGRGEVNADFPEHLGSDWCGEFDPPLEPEG